MKAVARWARAEWGLVHATAREVLAEGPLRHRPAVTAWVRAFPATLAAVALTALLQFAQNRPWGYGPVQLIGAVRAVDPLWTALLRTPVSLFVPALDLPVWGALTQILCVFGVAEICLGRSRTLAVAYAATLAGTLYARVGVALGPGRFLGLSGADAAAVDTGPSAAVVGLAVYLGWRYRAYLTAGAVVAAMSVEVILKNNLAGREHLAAITCVALVCALSAAWRRWRGRRLVHSPPRPGPGSRTGCASGLPPIQS
ncbi:hypothetical protein [Streptomyces sp. NPDC046985]|uniref:hypothetical protein n=1 Tax=Streptomyces sp. NPDC046985 TaxID=3155377 RepID=UPI0033D90542